MGKIGPNFNNISHSVQIIPISSAKKRTIQKGSVRTNFVQSFSMQRMPMPYLSDPQLIPRVQKYLESNVDKTYVDIGLMADELQNTYREYAKRKRSAFRTSVKKAYSIVVRSYGLGGDQNGSSSEDDLEETESESSRGDNFLNNSMNNQMIDLYSGPRIAHKMDENELIDISSDDSEEEGQGTGDKASNGPSTSNKGLRTDLVQNPSIAPTKTVSDKSEKASAVQGKKRKLDASDMQNLTNKRKKSLAVLQEPSVSFTDIAGIDKTLTDICKLLTHVKHPEVYRHIGISPPRGFLLHGPPGCGKTLLANAIAGELSVPLLKVAAPELVAGISGESEERIRELFERAVMSSPCVLFIDEVDAITSNRQNAQKDMERRIVAQLITCLDDLNQNPDADRVVLIGATNRPDSMDPALRRAGRFDREIRLGIPDESSRVEILKLLTARLKLEPNFNLRYIGEITPGYVGADLVSLTTEAAMIAVNRIFSTLKKEKLVDELPKLTKNNSCNKKLPEVSENNKETEKEPEIIVDDDPKENNEKDNDSLNLGDSPVLVIEDENSKQEEDPSASSSSAPPLEIEKAKDAIAANAVEKGNEMNSEPVDVSLDSVQTEPKENSTAVKNLVDLLSLLHSSKPFSQNELDSLSITMQDFVEAVGKIQPSAKREGFATVPNVSWRDVGSLQDIRDELMMSILAPSKHRDLCQSLGITAPAGVLLCGPPGCGKTLVAKAVANEAGINFISVKGPELLNMYVGESERAVRTCFERARNSAPCVIFFDELDALCPKRSDSREGGPTMRVVNQMLTEMDGVEERSGVLLLAATNRPDIIDPAVLRPGRFDKILYVGLPSAPDRVEILKTITKNGTRPLLTPDVDLEEIGRSNELFGYTGADLAALVREASSLALREVIIMKGDFNETIRVSNQHLKEAITKIRPSVSEKDRKHYEKLRKMYTAYTQNEVEEMELS